MAKKKDPSVGFLNKWGFNVVKLPRAGIEPLDVVGREKTAQWLGSLSSIWTSDTPEPVPAPPRPAAMVNGQKTDALEASFGLSILSNALSAFGASVPSLDVAYKQAHQVQFSYSNVSITQISPLDAGNYLASGKLHSANPVVKRYFEDPHCKAFLITSVLKSSSITVSATDQHGTAVALDVPAISGLVGAKIGVKPSDNSNSTITFSGAEAVTFGFALQQIEYANGAWSLREAAPSPGNAFGGTFSAHGGPGSGPNSIILDTAADDCCVNLHYGDV